MENDRTTSPHYDFSEKYDPNHAKEYFEKHKAGFWRRLSNWREIGMARRALVMAGRPSTVLDLPCGTGRFWEMLCEEPERQLFVADNSQSMIDVGIKCRPPQVTSRIGQALQCSAFETGLPENFVECVFCIRLLHHIARSEDRIRMLKEFARISSGTVVVSLWVDGNFKAYRLQRKLERRAKLEGRSEQRDRTIVERSEVDREF